MSEDGFDLEQKYGEAEEFLGQGRVTDARAVIDYIETRQKILQYRNRHKKTSVAMLIVLLSVALVSIGALCVVTTTKVNITVTTDGLAIGYPGCQQGCAIGGEIGGQEYAFGNVTYFDDVNPVISGNLPFLAGNAISGNISIRAKNTQLSGLELRGSKLGADLDSSRAEAGLVLHNNQSNIEIAAINASLSAALSLQGLMDIRVQTGNSYKALDSSGFLSSMYYLRTGGSTSSVHDTIMVSNGQGMSLSLAGVKEVKIAREDPSEPKKELPTLMDGNIYFAELDSNRLLNKGEILKLTCTECEPMTVSSRDGHLTVVIKGEIDSLRSDYLGDNNNLMPTVLESLYKNQKLAMFWAAILFCWGFIWNLRSWTE